MAYGDKPFLEPMLTIALTWVLKISTTLVALWQNSMTYLRRHQVGL